MLLPNLPNELLLSIADNLESERDMNAFTQANRCLYNLLNVYLYRHNAKECRSSALFWASKHGRETTVLKSIDGGANVQVTDPDGLTPLSWAAQMGHVSVVKLLLSKDSVDPDSKDSYRRTPRSWAAEEGYKSVVKLLLTKNSVDPNSRDKWGRTPLSRAAEWGHVSIVELLLTVDGIIPDSRDNRGWTPLSWATENRHKTVMTLLPTSYTLRMMPEVTQWLAESL